MKAIFYTLLLTMQFFAWVIFNILYFSSTCLMFLSVIFEIISIFINDFFNGKYSRYGLNKYQELSMLFMKDYTAILFKKMK